MKEFLCSGYGHLSPETEGGKVVCIFYSLIGVPLNLILIGALAQLLKGHVRKLAENKSNLIQD